MWRGLEMETLECLVRRDGDGYVTNTVKGKRASCTWSEDEAVLRLGTRLLGDQLDHVERMPSHPCDNETNIHSRWRIVGKEL